MGQMRHVGHSVRWITIQSLKIFLMGTDNHQMRANVELVPRGIIFRLPGAEIHVRDANAINVRHSPSEAVLHPPQEYRIEAPWLIVRITRNSCKTGPFIRSLAKYRVFTSMSRWPIEHSRVLGDECRAASQCVRDLLRVSHRQSIWRLRKSGSDC